jgi:hypothetical protein
MSEQALDEEHNPISVKEKNMDSKIWQAVEQRYQSGSNS